MFGDRFDPSRPSACPTSVADTDQEEASSPSPCRVSFRSHLEDFEPEFITDTEEEEDDDNGQDYSESESDAAEASSTTVNSPVGHTNNNATKTAAEQRDKLNMMLDSPNRRRPPQQHTQIEAKTADTTSKITTTTTTTASSVSANSDKAGRIHTSDKNGADDDDEDIDEICEVIEDFGLANANDMLSSELPPMALTRLDRDDDNERNDEDDSGEDVDPSITSDSNLSCHSQMRGCSHNRRASAGSKSQTLQHSKPSTKTHHRMRRSSSSASEKTVDNDTMKGGGASSHSQSMKIQLNFKPCCEFKNAEARRLPAYCGYVSQYGLSKVQLEHRDARRESHRMRRERRAANREAEESSKSRVNEEAFARWLTVKMRTTRSTIASRNMYDCVSKRMSGAATAAAGKKRATAGLPANGLAVENNGGKSNAPKKKK